MMSDVYGLDGSQELRTMSKKLRLDRVALRCEGHPQDEHYMVPPSKFDGMGAREGVKTIPSREFVLLRAQKSPLRAIESTKITVSNQNSYQIVENDHFDRRKGKNSRFRVEKRREKAPEWENVT